jgi:hypothetical protein
MDQLLAEIKARDISKLTQVEWYSRFAYVSSEDSYFDMVERRELSRSAFNAIFRGVSCASVHNKRRIEASVAFDESRAEMGGLALEGITFAAGESALVGRTGLVYGNRWQNGRPKGVQGDASKWLEHLERMVPDEAERDHVLNVMAYKRQFPNRKINHAVLHGGMPGAGKDTLWAPFLWAIGGALNTNIAVVRNEELASQWGYVLESEVVVINELRQSYKGDQRAMENTLKPLIAAPPELLQVNRKGLHPYYALNRLFVLAFSNDRNAIALPADDRRWFVLWSHAPRMEDRDAAALWQWYAEGGLEVVAGLLDARDVSQFNPGAAPMMTDAKAILLQQGMNPTEAAVAELIASRQSVFKPGVIAAPFHRIVQELANQLGERFRVNQNVLQIALKDCKWEDRGRIYSKEYPTKKHVYVSPEFSHLSNTELRRMVENPPQPVLSVVK